MLKFLFQILLLFFILPVTLFGQDEIEEDEFIHLEKIDDTIGFYSASGNPLIAKKYLVDVSIYDYYFSPKNALLFLQMRDTYKSELYRQKGEVLVFDVDLGLGRWKRETDYKRSHFVASEKYILKIRNTDAYCFDFKTGDINWHSKDAIHLINLKYDFIIDASSKRIKAYSLLDKSEQWTVKVKKVLDNNSLYSLPNHKMLLSTYDVHLLDIENGSGNSFPVTLKKQTKKKEYYKFSTPKMFFKDPKFESIASNDKMVFFASMNKIYGININTEEKQWGTKLKESLGERYHIWIEGASVYLLNYDRKSRSFPAFIAKYDIETGKELFFHTFKQDIFDVKVSGEEVGCLLEDRVVVIDQQGEKNSFELRTVYGKPRVFVSNPIYKDRQTMAWESYSKAESVFSVLFEDTKIIILSDKLKQQNLNLSTVAVELESNKYMKLIKKGDDFFVLDNKSLQRVKITKIGVPELYKKTLLMMYDKHFYVVPVYLD